MSDKYFHIRTKDVRKIAEAIYEKVELFAVWKSRGFERAIKEDIINRIEKIINKHEKKLGNKDE